MSWLIVKSFMGVMAYLSKWASIHNLVSVKFGCEDWKYPYPVKVVQRISKFCSKTLIVLPKNNRIVRVSTSYSNLGLSYIAIFLFWFLPSKSKKFQRDLWWRIYVNTLIIIQMLNVYYRKLEIWQLHFEDVGSIFYGTILKVKVSLEQNHHRISEKFGRISGKVSYWVKRNWAFILTNYKFKKKKRQWKSLWIQPFHKCIECSAWWPALFTLGPRE